MDEEEEINMGGESSSSFRDGCTKPVLGMKFESLDKVYEFYNNYAKEKGFSTRKAKSVYWQDTKEQMIKYYVCSKEGTTKIQSTNEGKRCHMILRDECNAKLVVYKGKDSNIWVINKFVEEHNHVLASPHKVPFLRSQRNVSSVKKQLSKQFCEANIPIRQQIAIYEVQAGGPEHMGCTQKDLYNYQRDLRKETLGHDVELLLEHFESKKKKNSSFHFEMEVDNENRLDRVFWADATSRRAFGFYGDVIVFDTTFNTNRYDMKFAPIVGVNKHGSTILFGCAFLANERIESFIWLFERFKIVMPMCKPKMIITDQDAAISNAVAVVFPDTKHRLCIWHILKKFPEKLDSKSVFYDYKAFRNSIWNSETPEEFELSWMLAVEKNNAVGNIWLDSIYSLRSKWVPAFVNDFFSAGMSSSQRVESNHALFKGYISKKNSLFEFLIRFNRALAHQRYAELEKDHIDISTQPIIKSPMPMERQLAHIYTRKIFLEFQDELWSSMACILLFEVETNNRCYYNVVERFIRNDDGNNSCKQRKLIHERDKDFVSCSCKKFESEGIPCRHILAYLRMLQYELLPEKYVCTRWTKVANSGIILDENGSLIHDVVDSSLLMKKSRLLNLAAKIVETALVSQVATHYVSENFDSIFEKISSMVKVLSVEDGRVCGEATQSSLKKFITDPLEKRVIGSGKRLKSGIEKSTCKAKAFEKHIRHCHGCGQAGHDRRTCSMRNNM